MSYTRLIARLPGENFADGITTSNLGRPSYSLILAQHEAYLNALRSLGLEVILLPAEPDYPDAYFVEDPAIVTPQLAVLSRPGAPSRQGEERSLEAVLAKYRPLKHIQPPGTLDGGDILEVGSHFFIGLSQRTNREGAAQLASILESTGCTSEYIPVQSGLHLKSSLSWVGGRTLLLTKELADYPGFSGYDRIVLDPAEEYAANTLWVNGCLLMPAGFPETRASLSALGLPIHELNVSEVQKMDGGLTCMSLRL